MNYLLIGKPNVGKSSIFNILTNSKLNIVHPEEGTTRDWHKQLIKNTGSYIYDTPGILINDNLKKNKLEIIYNEIINTNINSFIYVIDYKDDYNVIDNFAINQLRKYEKEIILVINKFDNYNKQILGNFNKYGIDKQIFISCAHNYGIDNLKTLLNVNKHFKEKIINDDFSIAIFGKPNVGKSTLLNSLVGFNRSMTSPIAGTTSDYVEEDIIFKSKNIKIIDTAGIGKKSNIKNKSINFFSIKKSIEKINSVNTAIIVIDCKEGIDRQDKRIINLVSTKSKSIILIFNKYDLIVDKKNYKKQTILDIESSLSQIKNIKIFFISAFNKGRLLKIIDYLLINVFLNKYKISTSSLNKWLKDVTKENLHPFIENKRVNFKYVVQIKNKPVMIKIFCNYPKKLNLSYKRYLINNFNQKFKILNQKTKIIFASSINPYI